ncbi:uncharacterized protein PHALS_11052 [Plasmopara halstedii]|uniref:Uncharacterized protein n=1 Tax=Plasmopara halstedii TaxID=4781 RepID=A0A0P1AIK3_PLAHL|nr:uncharacterized protein PHALS_11052 [Plasmopara halstedii]CEG40873.1 hypothetical protein PHALS_11052 [Plasmopara halstedii]|eukprot:XP_024577242.1 hypothetical protein PHALS_11052 [Plasmopara halstedii]
MTHFHPKALTVTIGVALHRAIKFHVVNASCIDNERSMSAPVGKLGEFSHIQLAGVELDICVPRGGYSLHVQLMKRA